LGLKKSGFKIEALCEFEDHCKKVLAKNFPNAKIFDDVTKLNISKNEYDLICGGFPCQDISIAGKNKGLKGGDKSSLWFDFLRLINEGKPKYAIIENVSAILSRGLETILQNLAQIGYDATYTTIDSQYCGVPQRRRRVYILAVRDGIPEGTEVFNFRERSTKELREKVENIKKGRQWDFTKSEGERYKFAYFTRQRSDQFSEIGLSGTIAKRDYKSFTDLIIDDEGIRRVTPEERLLLQGFPVDWWDGCGLTDTQKFKCNGMTVSTVEYIGNCINEYERSI
jgi:DNA (cytosine-5)-methyltransferase 1